MKSGCALRRRALTGIAVAAPLLLCACSDSQAPDANDRPLPSVVVEAVTAKDVAGSTEFVGRTEASQRVDVRARVNGTLLKRPFEEGADVQTDAVLFEIDPAEFQASVTATEANLAKAKASFEELDTNLKRYEVLLERETASQAQYDVAKSKADQARADVEGAQAELERAKLDLSYATIKSPISGRAGISDADVGNLIGPDSGVLVTVLNLDPMDVLFSVGERDYLNYMESVKKGEVEKFTPRIRLANDKIYEQPGKVDVVDNKVDPATGTINVRLKFPNEDQILVPGQYVSVILTADEPEKRVVIPQAAVQENQAGPFVLIINGEGRVEARPVRTGERVEDRVVVLDGLTEGETLIVEGIQKVRPGAEVQTVMQKPADEPEVVTPQDQPEETASPDGESETESQASQTGP